MQQLSSSEIDQIILWSLLQHAERSYYKLIQHFGSASAAIQYSALETWQQLKLHHHHLERFQQYHTPQGQQETGQLLQRLTTCTDHILFAGHANYPALLKQDHGPPMLLIKGCAEVLLRPQIAMVGSRKSSPHGTQIAYDFAHYFAEQGYVVTSGLALGIDTASHMGAIQLGQTIAVIATGLNQCYPSANQALFQRILETGGAIVTEFLPDTPPRKAYFPRRNRLISGLSCGTLVVEAGLDSGSLITAQYAADQGKQVFAIPGHIYAPHHQGCHQLIREGATLVDHPSQVLQDLSMFSIIPSGHVQQDQAQKQPIDQPMQQDQHSNITADLSSPLQPQHGLSNHPELPDHLDQVYHQLDWIGKSIDELAPHLNLHIREINVYLVELELLGLCKQHAGRYLRC